TVTGSPFSVTVTVTDSASATGTQGYSLAVQALPVSVVQSVLPVGTVAFPYSQQLSATGGSGTGYTFSATGLPAGLTLSGSGLLSGTPTSATGSPFTINVTVTDSNSATGTQTYALTVDPAISVSPGTLPTATVGTLYSRQLTASGGSGLGYNYTASGLPAGL